MQLELGHPTDATKIVPAKANAQGALLVAFAGDATATATVQPTQALGITLNQGESTSWDNMLSLTLVNDDASTGDITIALESFATYLKPGESVSWDAAPSSVLSVVTITTPVGTTGRMFGTRYAPVLVQGG